MGLSGFSSGMSFAFLTLSWNFRSSTLPLFFSASICSLKSCSRRAASPLSEESMPPRSIPDFGRGGGSWAITASSAGSMVRRPLQPGQVTTKLLAIGGFLSSPSREPSAHHCKGSFDVGGEARAPGGVRPLDGERLFVRGGEPRGDAGLGLVQRGAARRLLAHRAHHVVHVAAEGLEPVAPRRLAVAHDETREVELGEAAERAHPVLGVAVAHERRP